MGRSTSQFICQQCNYQNARWFGRCPECGSWNTAVETLLRSRTSEGQARNTKQITNTKPVKLTEITNTQTNRALTGISELDRVLGGGIVPGQVILIAGEPGIGKSTLLLQVASQLTANGLQITDKTQAAKSLRTSAGQNDQLAVDGKPLAVLYISGEESAGQIAIRAQRLGIKNGNIQLMESTDVDEIVSQSETLLANSLQSTEKQQTTNGPRITVKMQTAKSPQTSAGQKEQLAVDTKLSVIIVDSIQTMQTGDLSGMAGSVGQVRECAYRLVKLAKSAGIPVFIVGHVTKEGTIAGPSVLMHIVDTVLWFEGDKTLSVRLLRAVKNRFGPTDEVGIFSMGDVGLLSEDHPERFFLSEIKKSVPGSVISCVMNGTRPLMVEIQSLIIPSKLAMPRRVAQGIDSKKLELLLAVMSRRCGLSIYESDVYVSVMGGINIKNDPSIDLAVCLSLASGYFNKPIDRKTVVFGEVGLLGEVRGVVLQEKRLKEAKRLGFSNFVTSERFDFLQKGIKEMFKNS